MNASELLRRLSAIGAAVTVRGDKLHIDAPPEAIADLLPELRAAKLELLKLLSDRPPCSGCRNLRMAEVLVPGLLPPRRFTWGCAKGHLEHGHTTPDLRRLVAPDECLAAGDHQRAFAKQGEAA